ncbi:MAG TPA: ribonuclease Z, partial [Gaiellaceae bacterium]|nr:ribonuclease Z [Gaiellaceae bacterium]
MDLDVVFVGTSGSMPTAQRAPSALLVRRGGERLLFDCGEGTQRQLLRSDVGLVDLTEIYVTHFHADHVLGLPGMLKTFALRGRELPLTLYGPRGLSELMASLHRVIGKLTYPYDVVEVAPDHVLPRDGYDIRTVAVRHGAVALGYALVEHDRPGRFDVEAADRLGVPPPARGLLQRGEAVTLPDGRAVTPDAVLGPPRPGRKLVLTGDTAPVQSVVEAAAGADLLVHEATFCRDELERARETEHSTAADAAEIGREASVKLLALTHLSSRYSGGDVEREAVEVVVALDDLVRDAREGARERLTVEQGLRGRSACGRPDGRRGGSDVRAHSAPFRPLWTGLK